MKRLMVLTHRLVLFFAIAMGLGLSLPAEAGPPHGAAKPEPVRFRRALKRTHMVLIRAHAAAKATGKQREEFRKAVVLNRAARWALTNHKPAMSMHLTLKARALGRDVVKKCGAQLGRGQDNDARDEQAEAAKAPGEREMQDAMEAGEKTTGTVEELMKDFREEPAPADVRAPPPPPATPDRTRPPPPPPPVKR